ncbi:hypothetical protein EC973_001940 [Apophysomyces ossiformis]|uniref:Uncharacterized protein n=1 Tax=Apophysomyces ossiformis TaxID=679940 RepID=A0A8H7BYC9_9FUNG|nr:hypothetical protein EC973_001940 [Apophysomyces ossiformis]
MGIHTTTSRRPKILGGLTKSPSSLPFHFNSDRQKTPTTPVSDGAKPQEKNGRSSIDSDTGTAEIETSRLRLRVINPDPVTDDDDSDEEVERSDNGQQNWTPMDKDDPPPLESRTKSFSQKAAESMISSISAAHDYPWNPPLSTLPTPPIPSQPITPTRRQSKTLEEDEEHRETEAALQLLPPLDLSPFFSNNDSSSPFLSTNDLHTPTNKDPYPSILVAPNPNTTFAQDQTRVSIGSGRMFSDHKPEQPTATFPEGVGRMQAVNPIARIEERSLPRWYRTTDSRPTNTMSDSAGSSFAMPGHSPNLESASVSIVRTSTNMASLAGTSQLSKYAKASYSLTNHPDALKLYRSQANKTKDPNVQLSYAKYLLEIATLYDQNSTTTGSAESHNRFKFGQVFGNDTSHVRQSNSDVRSSISNVTEYGRRASATVARLHSGDENSRRKKRLLEEEGVRWIKRLAKEGVGEAAYLQAKWIDRSMYGFKKNPTKMFKLYEVAANQGIDAAVFALGQYYEKEGDVSQAISHYHKAADAGLVEAVFRIAKVHLHGELNQRQNMTLGLALLYQATEQATEECPDAPYLFGLILTNTYRKAVIPMEVVQPYGGPFGATSYFERAAQLGHIDAQSRIGYIYEHGLYGVPMNFAKSFKYYTNAAHRGNAQAMLGLSRLYNRGSHGPNDEDEDRRLIQDESGWLASAEPNEDEAFHWCQRAADTGLDDAWFLLGWYYEAGIGAPRDYEQAIAHYQKAAAKGHAGAEIRLGKTNSVTRQQHEEGKRTTLRSTDLRRDSQTCVIM